MARESTAPVQVEGKKPKGPKAVSHLEVHPKLGGGHVVKHVYTGYAHEPREYHFGKGEGNRVLSHLAKHAGLGPVKGEGSDHENAEEIQTD